MAGFVAEDTSEMSLTVNSPLPTGPKLMWIVNALGERTTLLAEDTREFTVEKAP